MSGDGEQTRKRTVAEIEADLAATREELTKTVDDLSRRVDPRQQAAELKERARDGATSFVEGVKAGDPKALGIAGAAAAAVLAIIGISVARRQK
ncbi:DUF3618 domain-containing protein [Ruania halotolerans]|uniref:DUF3618 domain-containing protein n=1 Tax=Ruania halotolerans TaxID=2897773 RepID=UPI001E311185|nr:DUF3618 domain-containing protein [Ruania halotolerans]UFU05987.1 DUF3618 domain-containing protein [Ruania halotolerans]